MKAHWLAGRTTGLYRGRRRQNLIERLEPRVLLSSDLTVMGNSVAIANNESTPSQTNFTDFGQAAGNGSVAVTRTYTVTNNTSGTISFTGSPEVTISGTDSGDFSVSTEPTASIAAGASTSFAVTFAPAAAGLRTATVTFDTTDAQIPAFNFEVQGEGSDFTVEGNLPTMKALPAKAISPILARRPRTAAFRSPALTPSRTALRERSVSREPPR
jgi:hypothetical protein